MSQETATVLHHAILAAGGLVWLLALRAHLRAFRPADPREPDLLRAGELTVAAPPPTVRERVLDATGLRSAT